MYNKLKEWAGCKGEEFKKTEQLGGVWLLSLLQLFDKNWLVELISEDV